MTEGTGAAPAGAGDMAARAWNAFQIITAIGSPIALGAALLFYFGWSRSQAEATAFGADVSVFDMSPNELALRSIDAVFAPGLLLMLAGLAGLWLHRMLLGQSTPRPWLDRIPRPGWARVARPIWTTRIAWALRQSWIVLLPAATILLVRNDSIGKLTLPFWIGLAIFGRVYGTVLHRRATGDTTRTPRPIVILVAALLTIDLFWLTERFANEVGNEDAQKIMNDPGGTLHLATIYSTKRLYINAPGVTPEVKESVLPDQNDSYRYKYDGLFLLQRSGGKYFFITGGWIEKRGQLIVVRDNDSVRLDFRES